MLFVTAAVADTININWMDGNTTYAQTTCEIGGDIILPTTPTKRGYTFKGWLVEYTRLEYIESTGIQYIDTGVLLSNTDVFEITFQSLNSLSAPIMGAISGGTSYTSTNNLTVTYNREAYSVYCDGDFGNARYSWNAGNRADGLKHTIKYKGLNIAPTLDGVQMQQYTAHTLTKNNPTVTTWLFGFNRTSTGVSSQSGVRIYDVYIQGKGHFIPARRNSDGVLGMYDLISNTFFTNQGTGSFIAGPVAENHK